MTAHARALAAGVLLFAALAAYAQPPPKVWRLGVLTVLPRPAPGASSLYDAFLGGMRELGYREGENLVIEWRHTRAQRERLHREATALVAWKPDVVFTVSGVNAASLRDANAAVPVVVGAAGDLVGMRLAKTLSRPGGNVTGLQILSPDLAAKRLQLLNELMPKLQRVALLHAVPQEDPGFYDRIYADLQPAAAATGVELLRFSVPSASGLDRAFAEMKRRGTDAVLVVASPFMSANRSRLIAFAAQGRIATMYETGADAEAGGLVAYGPKVEELFRRSALYVDRVLKGARPAEMPIEQPTQFELVINRGTATKLGLTIPASMLLRADRVID